jgi:hypothetical protein
MKKTVKVKLLAKKNDIYITYIFLNLETNDFLCCKQVPNWETREINLEEECYLIYKEAKEGDLYYNAKTDTFNKYKYTYNYVDDFVPIEKKIEIIL